MLEMIGQTRFEASFHVLFLASRYRIEIRLRAERATNFKASATRVPVP